MPRPTFVRSSLLSLITLVCMMLITPALHAQFRASLRGTVTDPQGAIVPGATVTLIDKNTNHTLQSTSDSNGIYQFNALPPAPYKLTAEAQGFKTKSLENVQIIPEQPNALDIQLDLGEVQQTVTVSGTTEALDTETANVSGTVSSNQIQHMPTFGRDVLKVAALAPGSFADNSQASGNDNYNLPGTQSGGGQSGGADGIFKTENGSQVIANGNQSENNGISIDGISTVSAVWGGATVITPSEDSVDNVKIVSNAYDAELGRFSGAQIQITSKSGSNQFHGSLFFTTHQPNLNAYQPYNGGNTNLRDDNHYEQFGGSLGGPIWKNKIFAFFNYETVREPNSNIIGNEWYETPQLAAMAPAGSIASKYLSFPGNGVVATGVNPNNNNCNAAGLHEGVDCRTIQGARHQCWHTVDYASGHTGYDMDEHCQPGSRQWVGNGGRFRQLHHFEPDKFHGDTIQRATGRECHGKRSHCFCALLGPTHENEFSRRQSSLRLVSP